MEHQEGYYLTNILTERVIPAENKNRLIYEGDIDVAYNKIYYLQGGSVFSPKDNISERNSDHFRPPEL
ncbi:unnamed protein product [Rhizophagus irregularis]|uniref:Uncharacterized protein n=1 Tax=Rhizophagus irregularis TaxID=588596 RepID=A0A916EF36_9GLOM|nr:unnamed protein product [Rhizophagus irregularis]